MGPQGRPGGARHDRGRRSARNYGRQWDTGSQGPKGDQGDQGVQGLQGIQGVKGDTGSAGAKGDTGATGPNAVSTATTTDLAAGLPDERRHWPCRADGRAYGEQPRGRSCGPTPSSPSRQKRPWPIHGGSRHGESDHPDDGGAGTTLTLALPQDHCDGIDAAIRRGRDRCARISHSGLRFTVDVFDRQSAKI